MLVCNVVETLDGSLTDPWDNGYGFIVGALEDIRSVCCFVLIVVGEDDDDDDV